MSVSFGSQATKPSGPEKLGRNVVGRFARRRFMPTLVFSVKVEGVLLRPRFVKTWITPAAASEPKSVAAAGPLRTSIRSISSGLRSPRRSSPAPPEKAQHVPR